MLLCLIEKILARQYTDMLDGSGHCLNVLSFGQKFETWAVLGIARVNWMLLYHIRRC